MNRQEYLTASIETCCKQRTNVHGEAEDSFAMIGDLWECYLTHSKNIEGLNIMPSDVAIMMNLLKVARFGLNPRHSDNAIDGAAYFAIAGELSDKVSEKTNPEKTSAVRISE